MFLTQDSTCKRGIVSKLVLKCEKCDVQNSCMSSGVTNKVYDINMRLVYSMRCIGKGQKAARTFCGVMNFPSHPARFERYNQILLNSLKDVAEESMLRASEEND